MALKSKSKATRVDIPHELGQWVELQQPSAGDLRDIKDLSDYDYNLALLFRMMKSWSYGDTISEADLSDLDSQTYQWLAEILPVHLGLRTEEEKKDSGSPSQDGRDLVMAGSPSSSDI